MMCPDCNGNKRSQALANYGAAGCKWIEIPCVLCQASGEISDERGAQIAEAKAAGAALKAERLARDETLLEAARRLGVKISEYSRMERGVVLP